MGRRKVKEAEQLPHPPRLYKLLGQVAKFYRRRFQEEPRARDYLAERGINHKHAFEVFSAGYCDGTLHDVLPFDDHIHEDLRVLGVLKDNGKELFRECVVFPLWDLRGVCVGMYGRRLFDSDVPHLYLPGARRGLVNWQASKRERAGELVLTESVIDALSLHAAGITSVVPCYGTGGFTIDHAVMVRRFEPKRIDICFDADEPGRKAAAELAAEVELQRRGGTVRVIELPDGFDASNLLVEHGPEVMRQVIETGTAAPFVAASAPPAVEEAPPPTAGATAPAGERTAQGFVLHIAGRRYETKAVAKQGPQLRVTLKASKASEPDGRFELSTIDLYSRRSREWFAGLCAELFELDATQAASDMKAVIEHVEDAVSGNASKREPVRVELTDTERAEAMTLLQRPDLMEQVLRDFEAVGYAEEVCNKQLGYLVAISRKLEKPLSLLIESRSSAGKSALQDAILGFVPEEEFLKYSRITDQALFYTGENALEQKLLVIEETTGMGGAVYSIRALQSGDELRVAATGKDPATGTRRTQEYTVKARTAVMMTTTDPNFDEETKSRFILATVNESAELTHRILEVQRQADTIEGIALSRRAKRIQTLHQNAQRLLERVTVANPYAPKLTFPSTTLQARRDNKKYLGLIKAVTLLYQHQHQRERRRKTLYGETVECIEATLDDIAIANRIAKEVWGARQGDVTPQARRLFGLIRTMLINGSGNEKGEAAFSRRTLRETTGWSDWQVRTHLGELTELEYIRVRQG
ncbi:MAG: toprim domain-containing protein, partial [Myxococcota bacterium]